MLSLDESSKPPFSAEECRILGCLLEKQLTTPNNYPLSLNALTQACNQKTSREPLMNLTEDNVGHIARSLIEFGWVIIQNSGRTQRIEQRATQKLKLTSQQQAVLAVLLLRHPQTLKELKSRTERMADFSSVTEIETLLESWINQEAALVIKLAPNAGQREARYYHTWGVDTLNDWTSHDGNNATSNPKSSSKTKTYEELLDKIDALEQRISILESKLSHTQQSSH